MPLLNMTARQDNQASIINVTTTDKNSVLAIRATLLKEGARFAPELSAIYVAMDTLAVRSIALIKTLLPVALKPAMINLVREIVVNPYRGARDKIQAATRDDASRDGRINEPPANLPFASDDRAEFRAGDIGEKANFIKTADRDRLAALIVAGRARFSDLPEPLWQEIIDRHALLSHIVKTGLQSDYATKPTPDAPIASGPDTAAAEAAAQLAMERWRDDQRAVDDASGVLRSVIVAVAVACDLSVDEAFAMLDGGAA